MNELINNALNGCEDSIRQVKILYKYISWDINLKIANERLEENNGIQSTTN